MHDPLVVAHEIPSPIPRRVTWRESGGRRWGFDVSRRTNPENLGEHTYPWWRPKGYTLRLAGRAYGLGRLATIWHHEPDDRDAFTVCKRTWKDGRPSTSWKWHVHHWHVQVHLLGGLRRRLFLRCAECGRPFRRRDAGFGYMGGDGTYHDECMTLRSVRSQLDDLTRFVQGTADDTTRWRVEYRLEALAETVTEGQRA